MFIVRIKALVSVLSVASLVFACDGASDDSVSDGGGRVMTSTDGSAPSPDGGMVTVTATNPNVTGGDGGTTTNGGADGATSSPGDGAVGDGAMPPGDDCASLAQRRCQAEMTCRPLVFQRAYQDMSHCLVALTDTCENAPPPIEGESRVVDEAACATASEQCDVLLGRVETPAACRAQNGDRGNNALCGYDLQCIAGYNCYGAVESMPWCDSGRCEAAFRNGEECLLTGYGDRDCDYMDGYYCSYRFDMNQPDRRSITDENTYCVRPQYGGMGDPCNDETEMRCAGGYWCHPTLFTCQALLGNGAPCEGALAQGCDAALGLSCRPTGNTDALSCQPAPFAPIGAQCGTVVENGVSEDRQCATAVAVCDTTGATPICEERVGFGEVCLNSPDNCLPGLTCRQSMCQHPEAFQPPVCN